MARACTSDPLGRAAGQPAAAHRRCRLPLQECGRLPCCSRRCSSRPTCAATARSTAPSIGPRSGGVELLWPGQRWAQAIDSFAEGRARDRLHARAPMPRRARARCAVTRIWPSPEAKRSRRATFPKGRGSRNDEQSDQEAPSRRGLDPDRDGARHRDRLHDLHELPGQEDGNADCRLRLHHVGRVPAPDQDADRAAGVLDAGGGHCPHG